MLRSRRNTNAHVKRTLANIREVRDLAGFTTVGSITADGVNRYLAVMVDEGYRANTINGRVRAIKAFTRWLARHSKLIANPLESISTMNPDVNRSFRRRMLLPDEWPRLRAAIVANGRRNGMEPGERAALYALAIQTGLRASECESLTKADLFLAVKRPYVRCGAENTKNRREAQQYIQADLAAELRALTASKLPQAPAFGIGAGCDLAEALRADLADARKQWLSEADYGTAERERREASDFLQPVNHAGEALDFHSLRYTCGAWLTIRGVHPKTVQTVMRHSTIKLTMDLYGRLLPDAAGEAVNSTAGFFKKGAG
jgi:integrase